MATRPWHEYRAGLSYMRSVPLMMGMAMISVGWSWAEARRRFCSRCSASRCFIAGRAASAPSGDSRESACLIGGAIGHVTGRAVSFGGYKRTVTLSYLLHGAAYMLFSQAESYAAALVFMMFSRVGMAVTSVLNNAQLLRHTPDQFRGRVFSTMESIRWSVMIVSMSAAGIASQYVGPRTIGLVAGAFGSLTAIVWAWMDWSGRLPEP